MKNRIVSALLALIIALAPCVFAFAAEQSEIDALRGTTLYVYNWGEYISDGVDDSLDVNAAFEEKYGINVVYETYDNNEVMYSKLKGGGVSYDIVIPSDYMIQRMIAEDMLQPLDFSNIPNYKYIPEKYKNIPQVCLKKSPDFSKLDAFCVKYGLNSIRKEFAAEAPLTSQSEMVQDDLFSF